jgi:hypothetical protein
MANTLTWTILYVSQVRNDEDDPRDLLAELERVGYLVRDRNGNLTLNRSEPPEDE